MEVHAERLTIHHVEAERAATDSIGRERLLTVPWQKTASTHCREILLPEGISPQNVRRIRSENRATLIASIARGRRWLEELVTDLIATTELIAKREGCTVRKVNMTISLAFLPPDLVKAAIDGTLPHGMGVVRLADLPAEWSEQHPMLGTGPPLALKGNLEPRLHEPSLRFPGNAKIRARPNPQTGPETRLWPLQRLSLR